VQPAFVFCADTHLADGAWTSRPAIYGDAYYSFAQIADYCIQHKLPLILGGDVLEKKSNAARPIAMLCRELSRLQAENVPVYYIQGNHEYDRNAPWLSVHPWPQHIHKRAVEIGGVRVYGLDWLPKGDIQTALSEIPADTEILITHQVWQDFMKNVGRTECSLTDVHHAKIVLAGDFHVTETVVGVNAQNQPTVMLSPGSTCMQDISEASDKYFFELIRRSNGELYCGNKQLKTRRFSSYTVKDAETLDRLCAGEFTSAIQDMTLDTLPEEIRKPLIRVKFDKRLPDAHLRISTAIGESAHLFCDALVDKSRGEEETNRAVTKNDLVLTLEELMREAPESLQVAMMLLNSDSPAADLEKHFVVFQAKEENVDAVNAT